MHEMVLEATDETRVLSAQEQFAKDWFNSNSNKGVNLIEKLQEKTTKIRNFAGLENTPFNPRIEKGLGGKKSLWVEGAMLDVFTIKLGLDNIRTTPKVGESGLDFNVAFPSRELPNTLLIFSEDQVRKVCTVLNLDFDSLQKVPLKS